MPARTERYVRAGIVRKSPELDIPVRFWTGLLRLMCHSGLDPESILSDAGLSPA